MTRDQAFGVVWQALLPGPELGSKRLEWPNFRWRAYYRIHRMIVENLEQAERMGLMHGRWHDQKMTEDHR